MIESELRNIIREEIKKIILGKKKITEGGDLILLKSIGMLIDKNTGDLYPKNLDFPYGYKNGSINHKYKMSKLDVKDKKIVKSLNGVI